jgi:hypothetical protein
VQFLCTTPKGCTNTRCQHVYVNQSVLKSLSRDQNHVRFAPTSLRAITPICMGQGGQYSKRQTAIERTGHIPNAAQCIGNSSSISTKRVGGWVVERGGGAGVRGVGSANLIRVKKKAVHKFYQI